MFGAIVILLFLPFIDCIKVNVQSDWNKLFFWIFCANFSLLKWIGEMPMEAPYLTIGLYLTVYHFLHFLFVVPFLGYLDNLINKEK
jgi:ubiquinol-cytochrome c reductase cytochrome b subunit